MAYNQGLGDLMDITTTTNVAAGTALTVWSIPQFEKFQIIFSQSLGELQHHLTGISDGQSPPSGASLLTSSMVNMAKAMTEFLQRRYDMMQRLDGLGRVVETESSRTWYAQPENLWLRKAVADLKAKCDAFSWVVVEICRASANSKQAPSAVKAPTAVTWQKTPKPQLRSYNSFSSIGSEAPYDRSKRVFRTPDTSNPSTPISNPFSDSSSVSSKEAYNTGPSTLEPNSPVETNRLSAEPTCSCSHSGDGQAYDDARTSIGEDPVLSAALRGLLQLRLDTA